MKNNLIKLIVVSLVNLFVALPLFAIPSTQLTKVCKPLIDTKQKLDKPPVRGMSEKVHKRLTRALENLANNQFDEAIRGLEALFTSSSDNYVKSIVSLNLANAYGQKSKGDYNVALPYYQNALRYGVGQLDHQRLQGLRQSIAGIMFSVDKKQQALDMLNEWLKKSIKHESKIYSLLGGLKAEQGKFRESVCPSFLAIKHAKKPKKSYYNTLLVAHWKLEDFQGSATILKEMVEFFPEETSYWRQLSSIYLELDKNKESLAIMEMLYLNGGFETENDYKRLSSLFAFEEISYRSAQVLEDGLNKGIVKPEEKNLRAVATNYQVSKDIDKAIVAFGRSAEVAKNGEHYLTQAELYAEKEEWREVIKSLNKALNKGVEDKGRAHFTKGSAQASLGECKNSLKTFELASKYKKWRSRSNAWISYVKDRQKYDKCIS